MPSNVYKHSSRWWGQRLNSLMIRSTLTLKTALLCSLAVSLQGCAGYRLGSMLPSGISSVHVPTFQNNTDQPQIEFQTTQATINELIRDGSLQVESEDKADSVLRVTLIDYELVPLGFERDRSTATDEYRVLLTARIMLEDKRTGKILFEDPLIRGESTFLLDTDLTSGKRLALPEASRDLAHDIVERTVEFW